MPQPKRRRKTKHRGNAAGIVETRGRTGRKPTTSERGKGDPRDRARQARIDRFSQPPTWRSAINRAAITTVVFALALLLLFRRGIAPSLTLAGFMFILYIPLGYYTDLFLYRRRQAKKAQAQRKAG
jgi:hypothetical protein